jgi:hypothetical protein
MSRWWIGLICFVRLLWVLTEIYMDLEVDMFLRVGMILVVDMAVRAMNGQVYTYLYLTTHCVIK